MPQDQTPDMKTGQNIEEIDFKVEVKVSDAAEVFVFHAVPFDKELSWIEFDLDRRSLDFVMNDGGTRNLAMKVPEGLDKHLQNTYQIMLVQMNEETGEPVGGKYYPLIIHRA